MGIALLALTLVLLPSVMKIPGSLARPPHVGPEKIPTYPCQVDDLMGWSYGKLNSSPINYPTSSVVFFSLILFQGQMRVQRSVTLSNRGTLPCTPPTTYPPKRSSPSCSTLNFTFLAGISSLVLKYCSCVNVCI